MIIVLVLQNGMDLRKGEHGSSTKTCVTSNLNRNDVTGIEAGRISVIKEEGDLEPTTTPAIKTEPKVSYAPVMSVRYISYRLYAELPASVSVCPCGTKFDSREWISSSF